MTTIDGKINTDQGLHATEGLTQLADTSKIHSIGMDIASRACKVIDIAGVESPKELIELYAGVLDAYQREIDELAAILEGDEVEVAGQRFLDISEALLIGDKFNFNSDDKTFEHDPLEGGYGENQKNYAKVQKLLVDGDHEELRTVAANILDAVSEELKGLKRLLDYLTDNKDVKVGQLYEDEDFDSAVFYLPILILGLRGYNNFADNIFRLTTLQRSKKMEDLKEVIASLTLRIEEPEDPYAPDDEMSKEEMISVRDRYMKFLEEAEQGNDLSDLKKAILVALEENGYTADSFYAEFSKFKLFLKTDREMRLGDLGVGRLKAEANMYALLLPIWKSLREKGFSNYDICG